MLKKSWIVGALLMLPCVMSAQSLDSLKVMDEDLSSISFSESQLGEDEDVSQTVSTLVSAKSDPYLSKVGYLFSPMRFQVRAYDNTYNQVYLNGLMVNDPERGSFAYSMIGGLNDATRNREGVTGFDSNSFGYTGVGGGQSINMRPSAFAQGNKVALSLCNRNYTTRAMYTYGSGINKHGWAFAASAGYRWADEGVIEGTFYNSLSYFLGIEKVFDHHSLSLVTFGSPTERAQQGASTEEAYWLANSHYYNPNWGYQNGKKRNARVVNDFQPTALLTWLWDYDKNTKLNTTFGFKYGMYSSTALGWNGDAYDPRPDYYKNLPSSVLNVYDTGAGGQNTAEFLTENEFLRDQWNELYHSWTSSKAHRQINWDRMYYVNQQNEALGGDALYYVERRHNDQMQFALSSTFNKNLLDGMKYTLGVQMSTTKGMHYKTMADLLGGTRYVDVDKFAANDYGAYSDEAQNDLNNPNRRIGIDDKFGYNYNIYVDKMQLWGQWQHSVSGKFDYMLGSNIEGTAMKRVGLMRNGRAADNSYGTSGMAGFLGGGAKASMVFRPWANQRVMLSGGYNKQAPLARNSFVAAQMQNNYVDHLTLEDILSTELAYTFRFGALTGKVSGFYTWFRNQIEQTAFYNDQESRFTYLTMSGINKKHYGIEGALVYQVNSNLSFKVLGTISEAKYTNNPYAQVSYQGMDALTVNQLNQWVNPVTGAAMPLRVIAQGNHINGTPLTALNIGANYNIHNWFFELNLNYYDRAYVDFSEYRRLGNVISNYTASSVDANGNLTYDVTKAQLQENGGVLFDQTGKQVAAYTARQEKFDGGMLLDASIGRYIRLPKGRSLSINLSLNNILNNTNMRTGGYEQNRDDNYASGEAKAYVFSKNAKYYYANAFNLFLNIGYKF